MSQVFCFAFEVFKNPKGREELISFIKERKGKKDSVIIFCNKESAGDCAGFISSCGLNEFVQLISSSSFVSIKRVLSTSYSGKEIVWVDSDLDRCRKAYSEYRVFYVEDDVDYLKDLKRMTDIIEASTAWAATEKDISLPEELRELYSKLNLRIDAALREREGSFDDEVEAEVPDLSAWGGAAGGAGVSSAKSASPLMEKGLFGGARSSGGTLLLGHSLARGGADASDDEEEWPSP